MNHFKNLPGLLLFAALGDMAVMAKDYPLQVKAEKKGNKADIRIEGTIWGWDQEDFKMKVDELIDSGAEDVNLYINSPGGDVFAANQIVNELERFEGKVKGHGGALVASAASLIAISCDEFTMSGNGQFMYHKPMASISGNEDAIESRLKLLKNITDQYRAFYAEKTGKSTDEIEEEWSKGDVWLTADEAFKQGFITGISKNKEKVSQENAMMIAACGGRIDPAATSTPEKEDTMKNREAIIAKLKLAKDATDEQIEAALDQYIEKAAKVDQLEADAQKKTGEAIDMMLQAAVDAKKIKADQKDRYKVLAEKDFENTKALLDDLSPLQKVSAQLGSDGKSEASRADWSMQDYIDKDPEALDALMGDDPDKFTELMTAHYR